MVLLAKHIKGAYSKEDKESKVFFKTKNFPIYELLYLEKNKISMK